MSLSINLFDSLIDILQYFYGSIHLYFFFLYILYIIYFLFYFVLFYLKAKRIKRPLTLQCGYIQTHNTIKHRRSLGCTGCTCTPKTDKKIRPNLQGKVLIALPGRARVQLFREFWLGGEIWRLGVVI